MLFNPPPDPTKYEDLDKWAKDHRDWKCQTEGWTYSAFNQYCEKVMKNARQ